MLHAWEMSILERHALLLQHPKRPCLQVRREHGIHFRREHLHWHAGRDGVDVRFGDERRVADREAVEERLLGGVGGVEGFRGEVEAGPAAVAVAYGAEFGVLGAEVAGAGEDFGRAG